MKVIKLSALAMAATLAIGCTINNYTEISQDSGLQADSLNGNKSRTIQFSWVSGSKNIGIDLYSVTPYGTWSFIHSAEIYIGKEAVAKISGNVDRTVGTYNNIAKEHEKVEVIHGIISVAQAEKIANADYKNVTIRFYGKNGYVDATLPRDHKLINVVNLAKSA